MEAAETGSHHGSGATRNAGPMVTLRTPSFPSVKESGCPSPNRNPTSAASGAPIRKVIRWPGRTSGETTARCAKTTVANAKRNGNFRKEPVP